MNVLLSAAAGLLAADAFCKRRKSTARRVTRSRMDFSSSDSSSSESSTPRSRSYQKRRRKHRNPQTTLAIRSGPSTSSASTTSRPSSSSSESQTTTDSDPEDSSTDSSESTIPHSRRLCHGRLPNNINYRNQLPNHNTLITRYTSPEHPSSSDADSSSSDSDLSSDTDSTNSASASRIAPSSPSQAPPLPPRTTPHPHYPSPLQTRLSTFLPTIRASNAALERERLAGTLRKRDIENLSPLHDGEATASTDEEKRTYIEMDLGLGVLEEQKEAGEITPSGIKRARSRDSEGRRSGGGEGASPLETLMGIPAGAKAEEARDRKRRKVGIEVVD